MERLLCACGCPDELASAAAEVFLEAELRGIGVQGIDYLPYLIANLRAGNIDPAGRPRIVKESAAAALVDGGNGLGQPAALLAADTAARKAREAGAAAVGITRSQDIFMIGYYAERIACSGCVGIVCTSGGPLVHAHGGVDRVLSTNPIAFGIPTEARDPIVFDMATSAISNARIRQAAYHGEQVPPGSGVGPDGLPTTDAATIRKGAIGPLAGYKGFGLSLCVAMLSGPLTGSGFGAALAGAIVGERADSQGHFMDCSRPPGLRRRSGVPRRSECLRRRDRDIEAGSRVGNHSHARAAGLRRAREAPSRWHPGAVCDLGDHLGTRRRPRGPRARRLKRRGLEPARPPHVEASRPSRSSVSVTSSISPQREDRTRWENLARAGSAIALLASLDCHWQSPVERLLSRHPRGAPLGAPHSDGRRRRLANLPCKGVETSSHSAATKMI